MVLSPCQRNALKRRFIQLISWTRFSTLVGKRLLLATLVAETARCPIGEDWRRVVSICLTTMFPGLVMLYHHATPGANVDEM